MGCVRRGCHYDLLRPVEHFHRKSLEKPPDTTDEEQRQTFAFDERIVSEHQEVCPATGE
jgi:hypothetical protein